MLNPKRTLVKSVLRQTRRLPLSFLEQLESATRVSMGKGWGAGSVREEVAACLSQLPAGSSRGPVALDIGANVGNWTSEMIKASPGSLVCAFEPSSAAFGLLAERFSREQNVRLAKAAVGKEAGKRLLWFDQAGSGLASLTKRKLDHFNIEFNLSEEVEVVTVDQWCEQNGIEPVIIKIDVEGHEMDVLAGAEKTLAHTSVVQFEFGGCNIDSRTYFQDFYYFFREAGFLIKRITPRGLADVPKYREEDEVFQTTNYLAVSH